MGRVVFNDDGLGLSRPGTDWQTVLRRAVTDPVELCRRVGVDPGLASAEPAGRFPVLVPGPLLDRVRPGDPDDPILRQVLPVAAELEPVEGFSADPLDEAACETSPGLLHRYARRSLIITTGRCGVHCRYCFRRCRPGTGEKGGAADVSPARAATGETPVAHDEDVREVILSGGDPLVLDDAELEELVARLERSGHVRRLRVHSRMPVAIPGRVTDPLLRLLRRTRLTVIVVVQANHAAELDAAVGEALGRFIDAGIPVLCQSVLLRGVNDSVDALAELMERLVDLRVTPYYLHQLDRVAGAAHFEVPVAEGRRLVARLRELLPGYAVPRYVRQVADGRSKRLLDGAQ